MRLKAVHIFNNSYIFNMLFSIFKPFIREKLRKRVSEMKFSINFLFKFFIFHQIFFHGKDPKSLTKHVSPEILPPRYGGTLSVPDLEGKVLVDLYQLYTKEFDSKMILDLFYTIFFNCFHFSGQLFRICFHSIDL